MGSDNMCDNELQSVKQDMDRHYRDVSQKLEALAFAVAGKQQNHSKGRSAPIFVLGCTRSGTTIISRSLEAAGIPGWSEGHVFPIFSEFRRSTENYIKGLVDGGVLYPTCNFTIESFPTEGLYESIINFIDEYHVQNLKATRWFDKTPTPEMTAAVPDIAQYWPDALFIYCRRRGVDNVQSKLRKFKNQFTFSENCHRWTQSLNVWDGVKGTIPDRYIEIDHADIVQDPASVVNRISAFLGLNIYQNTEMLQFLTTNFPELTGTGYSWQAIDKTGWSDAEKHEFYEICGPMMQQYNYPMDGELYFDVSKTIFLPYSNEEDVVDLSRLDDLSAYREAALGEFLLHPAADYAIRSIGYKNLEFDLHRKFLATLDLRNHSSQPVMYTIEIVDASSKEPLWRAEQTISVGEPFQWVCEFPPISGLVDVWLSTQMAPNALNNFYAWAHWGSPRFTK